jgi:hypothetical protein
MSAKLEGADDFERALDSAVPDLDKRLKQLDSTLSARIVADARSRASTRMAQRAASAGLSAYSGDGGGVTFQATPETPYAMGSEFGAAQDVARHRSGIHGTSYVGYRQFEPHAGSSGYWLWPAIRAAGVVGKYGEALDTTIESLGGE